MSATTESNGAEGDHHTATSPSINVVAYERQIGVQARNTDAPMR